MEGFNKLIGPNDAKARPVEYWKESATDQEDAYGTDPKSSLKPPALLEWPGAEYFRVSLLPRLHRADASFL